MARKSKIIRSSGNVFADLGLESSREHDVKARLVMLIAKTIAAHGFTQAQAAVKMGLKQPDVSKLLCGRFEGFSLERLLFFVRALGSDVEIRIKSRRPEKEGRLLVTA